MPTLHHMTLALAALLALTLAARPAAAKDGSDDGAAPEHASRTYFGIGTGLTALPYDSEVSLQAGIRVSNHFSFETNLRTEALSLIWAGTWWNVQLGVRFVPTGIDKLVRPTFAMNYGGGGLTNKYTTVGNPIYEEEDGVRVPYPTKVTWSRHASYSRLDLEGGVRWQRPGHAANVSVVLGVYTIPGQRETDEWLAREKQGLDQELLETTFQGVDGAGYSHWFDKGYSTVMIRVILGMDLI